MYRYKSVEPKYMSTNGKTTKDLDDYFVNLQRLLAKKPQEISNIKLNFQRNNTRRNIIKLRNLVKQSFKADQAN